ncbi:hypothetical protein JY651_40725 [Pyxidicoccus parkwayensis]|uniref:Ig-like domain-containing protein n=1 Tax=Pyxidicoccus parkwayensis TaxID=2813578 RepID=A0ABX7NRE7_9BACT|nr:hypothetical protein [Pyxidicoccus parkwaysis]QSQ21449.1 hypothetical protein JY651_40725 [Pyxidicoccus parkwaysis]
MPALRSVLALAVLVLLAAPASRAAEDVPRTLAFQGRLVRADGTPENTPQDLTFALYTTANGGSPLWQERQPAVPVTNGYYAVVLGAAVPLRYELADNVALYLGVALTGQSELTPRLQLASVPFALRAQDSRFLEGRSAATFANASHEHPTATSTTAGFMSAADKAKLDTPAPETVYSDGLTATGSPLTVRVSFATSGGNNGTARTAARSDHAHANATSTTAGFMSAADKAKLDTPEPTFGDGLSVSTGTPATVSVNFASAGGNNGTSRIAARADHTHAKPVMACTYRQASGNDSGDSQASVAWCASGEQLTGGGCGELEGPSGVSFMPTGVTLSSGAVSSGGPGYRCRNSSASVPAPTAYAICCRIP